MWYVANDHHKRHLTICVRDEQGNIIRRGQVSTRWYEVRQFFCKLRDEASPHGGYVVIMEVCGFNGWLIKRLARWGCQEVYLVKAPERVRQKTDRPTRRGEAQRAAVAQPGPDRPRREAGPRQRGLPADGRGAARPGTDPPAG